MRKKAMRRRAHVRWQKPVRFNFDEDDERDDIEGFPDDKASDK